MIATANMTTIRRATAADIPRLGRFGALLVEVHHELDAHAFCRRDLKPADYGGFLSSRLQESNVAILVADDGGDVVGYAHATVEGYDYMALRGPAGVIQDIVVDPAMRRRGIGRALVDAIIVEPNARAMPQIVLSAAAQNDGAQKRLSAAGFYAPMIEMARPVEKAITPRQDPSPAAQDDNLMEGIAS